MANQARVMIGMSFFTGNCKEAGETAKAFAASLGQGVDFVLGVETGGLMRSDPDVDAFVNDRLTEPWCGPQVAVWDSRRDDTFFKTWPAGRPMPFYDRFSYGGAVNRMLALAAIADCEYLVRIDPGTRPPYYFAELVRRHIELIRSKEAAVASGLYTDRIALRDDFVPLEKREDYHEFIHQRTGIDPRRQITGGAAFTVNVAGGPPAIPFPGYTPVWGSDDGLFAAQWVCGRGLVLPESRINRIDPGQAARHGVEYPVRLASMSVLRALSWGASEPRALTAGFDFLEQLESRGFSKFYVLEASAQLENRLASIVQGYKNYPELKKAWPSVIQDVANLFRTP